MNNIAIILAGGRGNRFWPHSRYKKPKQLLQSPSGNTMLRDTYNRIIPFFDVNDIYVATTEDLLQPIREMVPEIDLLNYIVEPKSRDTAAAIALSTLLITSYRHNNTNIAIFPVDHFVTDNDKFNKAIDDAFIAVNKYKKPIMIGIKSEQNETRYGYICAGKKVDETEGKNIYIVENFKEKPDIQWIEDNKKDYKLFWNTGIYVFPSSMILKLVKELAPQLDNSIQKIAESIGTLERSEVIKKQFKIIESVSFEYAILEKINNLLVIDGQFGWQDIGSWNAYERFLQHDDYGNIIQGEHSGIDTHNCIIVSDKGLTVTIGLSDMVIINNGPIQLIYPKNREGDIKKIIRQMSKNEHHKKYL